MGYAIIEDGPNGLRVNYEDFGVEAFGGMDYECTYILDKANRDRLERFLRREHAGPLEKMIREHFGAALEKEPFGLFCDQHEIKYELSTWIS